MPQVRILSGFSLDIDDITVISYRPYLDDNKQISIIFRPEKIYSLTNGFYMSELRCYYSSYNEIDYSPYFIKTITGGFFNLTKGDNLNEFKNITKEEEKRRFIESEQIFPGTVNDYIKIRKSIVFIKSDITNYSGSGFIIEKNILVTNLHVLNSLIDRRQDAGLDSIFLSYSENGTDRFYGVIEGVLGLDIASDLVLLKLKENFSHDKGLRVSKSKDQSSSYIAGFPDGEFVITSVTNEIDMDHVYILSNYHKKSWRGGSGSPVIDEKGRVNSVIFRAYTGTNTTVAIKGIFLKKLLEETYETLVHNDDIYDWIDRKNKQQEQLIESGNMYVQDNRGLEIISSVFTGKIDMEDRQRIITEGVRLLTDATEKGNPLSRISLGLLYCESGERMEEHYSESSKLLSSFSKETLDAIMTKEAQDFCVR